MKIPQWALKKRKEKKKAFDLQAILCEKDTDFKSVELDAL